MNGSYKVIDCNRYVVEPADLWDRYLDDNHRREAKARYDPVDMVLEVCGSVVSTPLDGRRSHSAYRSSFEQAWKADFSAESNLGDMDREGIDIGLLLPTAGMYVCWSDSLAPSLAAALASAYNNFLADYCSVERSRLKGVALLATHDAVVAAAELRRCVETLGFVAGVIRPNPVGGNRLYDRAFDAIYGEAEALDVPILIHAPIGSVLPELGHDRFESELGRAAVGPIFEQWLAVLSCIGYEIFERFPKLRIGFVGAGCGWLPYWLDRIEEHWETGHGSDAPGLHSPRLQFGAHCFVTADPWESLIPDVMRIAGVGSVVWGSQYPSIEAEATFPHDAKSIVADDRMTDAEKSAVLASTAARLFHIATTLSYE